MTLKENDYLYSFKVIEEKDKEKKTKHLFIVASLIAALNGQSYAYGAEPIDYLKLYAHSRIISEIEYNCFNKLITKESNWRINAINGSHYGLGQMRNPKYRNLDGYRMIDWSIKYIGHRYSGSSCKAFAHWKAKGWH